MSEHLCEKLRHLANRLRGHDEYQDAVLVAVTTIHKLELELTEMRTFVEAAKILVEHDAKLITDNATLTASNATLTSELALAAAATPETLAAQASIVNQAQLISPEVPAVIPA